MRPTIRTLALVAYALLAPALLAAQDVTLRTGTPEEAGMSAAHLRAGVELYRQKVAEGELVGAVLLVARRGTIVLHEALGLRNRSEELPMEKSTMFRMASNTKPAVAAGVATLVEEEELSYDDLVREHIASFDNYRAGFITIDHLLTHASGFRINSLFLQPLMEPSAEHPDAPTLQLEAARFGEVGAEVVPGTSYEYSNPGYNTLGALIEMASGRPLEAYLDEAIYEPLGMVDSYHHEVAGKLDGKLDRMSEVYYERNEQGEWVPGWSPGDEPQMPFVRASGGMISTARDYAIFLQTFLNGGVYGGTRILDEASVEAMTEPRVATDGRVADDERRTWYGYGWFVDADGIYYHGGSDGTYAWVDPANEVIGLVFTQMPRGENPGEAFMELVRLAIEDEEE